MDNLRFSLLQSAALEDGRIATAQPIRRKGREGREAASASGAAD